MTLLVQHVTASVNTSGTTVAVTVTALTSGNLLVVGWGGGGGHGVSSITDNGGTPNSYTQCASAAKTSAGSRTSDLWYSKNIIGGATSVTLTETGTADTQRRTIEVWEISGADATSPFDTAAGGGSSASSVDTGPSITTASANEIILAVCRTGGTVSSENDATLTLDDVGGGGTGFSHGVVSSTGTYTPAWNDTISSTDVAISVGAFKQATSGGGGPTPHLLSCLGAGT